ncbi:S8 family serine peptidase [Streptomyces anandii]|uniref:S8 family serine peptidase n=1 Tax=Streptomyces anandii TaxID=285454 RepID=UPI0037A95100
MTSPASADTAPARDGRRATGAARLAPHHSIALITGDRVTVDAKGRVVGLERAEGREHIPVQVRTVNGHTLVVPADAVRLVASGKLDQRLFDITELNTSAARRSFRNGLKAIVGYRGAASAARSGVRSSGTVRRSLAALNADAVQIPETGTHALWKAVTDGEKTAAGIAHIWLDGVRRASLDKSVPQIGAPAAWKAGYTGKGVKIAVLDTGVDATHPDLRSQVIAARNFTASADVKDRYGHGTHVASIAAGTGAKSKGRYKGVAPGAKILSGKVLDDTGSGDDSGILAGMEWAAQQGADIVNLSLGGPDTPGVDPLEAEVNTLSAQKGILFAIAAGNGGRESVGSPGSADAALTVGAVDKKDRLADFSSTGPRVGDGAIKPDVTAPGVDITAAAAKGSVIDQEVGENPPGYLTISGTSMATPHVAGAAALLKQEHPKWGYAELKGALTGSAKGGAYTPFEQGTGRIAVDRAIKQTVVADPVSLNYGVQAWPHTDDKPLTRKLTYRNLGSKPVTLALTSTATGPGGKAAPAGFFRLGATEVTVPAGGTASVDVTVDTRLGGTLDGAYFAYVTATGGGQSVRTAAAVTREAESYDVTLKVIGRDGRPTKNYETDLEGLSGPGSSTYISPYDPSGTVTVRVLKGTYLLNSLLVIDPDDFTKGSDWLVQPKLDVTANTTVTLDARGARPVDITVPDKAATSRLASPSYSISHRDFEVTFGWLLDSYANFRTAHLGPTVTDGSLSQQWDGHWSKGADEEYDTTLAARVKQFATGYTRHYKAADLATVKVGMGASARGKKGVVSATGWLPHGQSTALGIEQSLPGSRTLHLSAQDGVKWGLDFEQHGGVDQDGLPIVDASYQLGAPQAFVAGHSYRKTFNTAVFGPHLNAEAGLFRDGDRLFGLLPLFADSHLHGGFSKLTKATTTLYRNGTKVGSNDDPLDGEWFKVPSADAAYRLTTSVVRSAGIAEASTRIDASWTFRSRRPSGSDRVRLPASTVRFQAATGLDSRVPAGRRVTVPVTVEGAAAGGNLKSLAVWVSYDHGRTWRGAKVTGGRITLNNPAKDKSVSFRAEVVDKKGNKSTLSIYNAYYGK